MWERWSEKRNKFYKYEGKQIVFFFSSSCHEIVSLSTTSTAVGFLHAGGPEELDNYYWITGLIDISVYQLKRCWLPSLQFSVILLGSYKYFTCLSSEIHFWTPCCWTTCVRTVGYALLVASSAKSSSAVRLGVLNQTLPKKERALCLSSLKTFFN